MGQIAPSAWARITQALMIGLLGAFWTAVVPEGQETKILKPADTLSAGRIPRRVISGRTFFGDSKYVGAETCKTCHQQQHTEWLATWHAKMERWPSPEIIVGDFNDRVVQDKDVKIETKDGKEETIQPSIRVHRQGDKFFSTLLDKDNPADTQTYEIAEVLGGKWNQHYEAKVGDNFIRRRFAGRLRPKKGAFLRIALPNGSSGTARLTAARAR